MTLIFFSSFVVFKPIVPLFVENFRQVCRNMWVFRVFRCSSFILSCRCSLVKILSRLGPYLWVRELNVITEVLLCLGQGETRRGEKDTIFMTLLAVIAKRTGEHWHLVNFVRILDVVVQKQESLIHVLIRDVDCLPGRPVIVLTARAQWAGKLRHLFSQVSFTFWGSFS